MTTFQSKITDALDYDLVGELKQHSISDIEQILAENELFNTIDPDSYHAVLISSYPFAVGGVGYGTCFNDGRNRFLNGTGIRTSTVKDIADVFGGIKLITTRNTRYLLIEV